MAASTQTQQLWQRFRAWTRPPRQLKTTTLGKIVITFAIVIGVAATNTGNNLLYLVLGGLFGIIAASGVLSERMLKQLRIDIRLPRVAQAGRGNLCGLTVYAGKDISSFLLDIELVDAARGVLGSVSIREIPKASQVTTSISIQPLARGQYPIHAIRVATRFPFQMYEKARFFALESAVWVAPESADAALPHWRARQETAERADTRRQRGDEFSGLRDRISSDPQSHIHWKRTASAGKHIVKVFTASQEPKIDVQLGRGHSEDEFESALKNVAGLLDAAHQQQLACRVTAASKWAQMSEDGSGRSDILLLLAKVQRQDLPAGDVLQLEMKHT